MKATSNKQQATIFILLAMGLSCLLFLVACLSVQAEEPVTLSYRYTPGKVLHYRYEVLMNGSQEGQTFSAKMSSKVTMETKKVEEDGSAWVDVRYDAFDMSQAVDGKEIPVGGKEGAEGEAPFKELIGKTASMHFQKDGKLLEIATPPEGGAAPPLEKIFGQMEGIFPDHPVRVGEGWTKKVELPVEGIALKMSADFQNTLSAFEQVGKRNCAKIKSVLKFSLPEGVITPQGGESALNISMKMEGGGELWQYFDVAEGMVVKTEGATQTTSTQTVTVPAAEGVEAQTLTNVSTIDMRFTTELEE